MSLVGPRPLPANHFGLDGMSRTFLDWSETRARVRPGLTGLWQVSGRNSLSFTEMIRLDLEYVQKRSLLLDLILILRTPVSTMRAAGTN
jgi:lipopolysaccharide/colanic/teichoic acid biosynthesis glycosyltransferase